MAASTMSTALMTAKVKLGTASRSPFAGGRCLTARVCVPLPSRRSGSVAVKALFTRNKQADVSGGPSTPSFAGADSLCTVSNWEDSTRSVCCVVFVNGNWLLIMQGNLWDSCCLALH